MPTTDKSRSTTLTLGSIPPAEGAHWAPAPNRTFRLVKRLIDIIGASISIVLCAPLFVLICAAIKLTSHGPVFFMQTRIGFHGKPFTFLKFRTMQIGRDSTLEKINEYVSLVVADGGATAPAESVFKIRRDPRVTPVGRLLRRTSLDELPQFINVLRGDMSLVGPRPPLVYEIQCYKKWHFLRLSCKPGITGLWQISGNSRLTFDEMVRLDIAYVEHASFLTDLKILLKTPFSVMKSGSLF